MTSKEMILDEQREMLRRLEIRGLERAFAGGPM